MQHEIQQEVNFDDLPLSEHIEWNHLNNEVQSLRLNNAMSLAVGVANAIQDKALITKIESIVSGQCF